MSSKRRLLAALVALAAAGYGSTAAAETAAANGSAKDEKARFTDAVRRYKAGSFAQALPEFEALATATGSPNAELYVGYCLNGLERRVAAYAAFERAARDAGTEERYEETRGAALREMAELGLHLGTLVVSPVETPAGLVVTVDGAVLEPAAFGSHRLFEPGDHHVEARATDRDAVVRDVHVDGGETKTVTLYFPRHDAAEPAVSARPSGDRPRAGLRIGGFVAAGVGGVGLVTFAVGGLEAKGTHDRLASECSSPCSDAAHQREVERGKSWQTVANVGLVVGGVGAVASAALLYFGYRSEAEASVALSPLPGGALLSGRGRF